MGMEQWRDLIIIISGLAVTLVAIFVAVILYLAYRRVDRILKSVTTVATKIEGLASVAADEIGKPLIRAAGLVQGIACGFRGIRKIFKKGE